MYRFDDIINVWAEKGWGMWFDLVIDEANIRFSIDADTLSSSVLKNVGSEFPTAFRFNLPIIRKAAFMLFKNGELNPVKDIGGTLITEQSIIRAQNCEMET